MSYGQTKQSAGCTTVLPLQPWFYLSGMFVRRDYTGCLDLIVGRVMAMWGEQDYR